MREAEELEDSLLKLIAETATSLPEDVEEALRRALALEEKGVAKTVYRAYLANAELAKRKGLPLCQDTGVPEFFVWLGEDFPYKSFLLRSIRAAVWKAVEKGYLRLNARDPVSWKPLRSGELEGFPWIHLVDVIEDSDEALIALYLSGGGASRPSLATTLDPLNSLDEVIEIVLEAIVEKGSKACPPLVVGVGLGSTIEIATLSSKLALLRPLNSRNKREELAELEERIIRAGNELNIGPQGLGGSVTVLDVHVEALAAHPSALSVAVSFSCWVLRRSRARIKRDLEFEVIPYVYGGR
ncbi:MAG: fumarate hydratase [Acidilobaceae archaeon]